MIIVKTNNGDRFINEAETLQVSHNKDKALVEVWPSRWGNQQQQPQYYIIEHVEAVIYTNAAQATQWKDEGSELEKLKAKYDENMEWSGKLRDEYIKIEQERDELKERLAQLEPKADPDRWWPDNVDSAPVGVILSHVGYESYDPGYEVRLGKIFESNNIKTVGDLLRIGRRNFRKYRSVGGGSISRIDNALEMLYDIKGW
jgi:hypothetical protein